MNMIRGVKLTSIPVTDQDRALAFYTEKLGFRLLTDQPYNDKQRWIELGISGTDTRVVLFRFDDGVQPGAKMNITFLGRRRREDGSRTREQRGGVCDESAKGRLGHSRDLQGPRRQYLCH
jgi:catechol 2,3-dioxygenase-like lactoylglutathione lyase family enzyme